MSNVVALDDHRPHFSGTAVCMSCKHKWAAVAPVLAAHLECPNCGLDHGTFKGLVRKDEPHWKCNCGNMLFHATPSGYYCPHCGEWQTGH